MCKLVIARKTNVRVMQKLAALLLWRSSLSFIGIVEKLREILINRSVRSLLNYVVAFSHRRYASRNKA